MITINGLKIDVADSFDILSAPWAVYTIEFEYDCKTMVHHALENSVHESLTDLINSIRTKSDIDPELKQALYNSEYITVNLNYTAQNENRQDFEKAVLVLSKKYELIELHKSYFPYGYNNLMHIIYTGKSNERVYARDLRNRLVDAVEKNASDNILLKKAYSKNKQISQYDKQTGIYIRTFASLKEAAIETGVCMSNISMCCRGYIKSAGGYIWSFEQTGMVDVIPDRRKARTTPITQEELAKKTEDRLKKYLKEQRIKEATAKAKEERKLLGNKKALREHNEQEDKEYEKQQELLRNMTPEEIEQYKKKLAEERSKIINEQ